LNGRAGLGYSKSWQAYKHISLQSLACDCDFSLSQMIPDKHYQRRSIWDVDYSRLMESMESTLVEMAERQRRTLRVHKMTREYLASIERERLKEKAKYCNC